MTDPTNLPTDSLAQLLYDAFLAGMWASEEADEDTFCAHTAFAEWLGEQVVT